jgi:hypothetical protein
MVGGNVEMVVVIQKTSKITRGMKLIVYEEYRGDIDFIQHIPFGKQPEVTLVIVTPLGRSDTRFRQEAQDFSQSYGGDFAHFSILQEHGIFCESYQQGHRGTAKLKETGYNFGRSTWQTQSTRTCV